MEAQIMNIHNQLEAVQDRIFRAAQSANRDPNQVKLVVVTKGQPVEVIQAAIDAGAQILGENYPEETLPKIEALRTVPNVAWHMIGHLQSRKAGLVAEHFDLLQSLDSLRIAEKLERLLEPQGKTLPVLLEFNVSGEESKFGWSAWDEASWPALLPEIENILALSHLQVQGLMTMPPLDEELQQSRQFFTRLRRLADFLAQRYGADHFSELSMGTSADFDVAVQEGATFVRVGTAILGPRPRR